MRIMYGIMCMLIVACSPNSEKQSVDTAEDSCPKQAFVGNKAYGDFDGDHTIDTVAEVLMAMDTRQLIDSFPDPQHMLWDSLVIYASQKYYGAALITTGAAIDTLYLGNCLGTYALLNVGDVNQDGTDDLALVENQFDFSALNSCKLYSLCHGRWQRVASFAINENAFDGQSVFTSIPEYLEQRGGGWVYRNYDEIMEADAEVAWKKIESLQPAHCK